MIKKTEYEKIQSYITKDGSVIRELMHPDVHGNVKQSLAEATIPAGGETVLHRHLKSEEIYHITRGQSIIFLGKEQCEVKAGDTIYIPSGTARRIKNTGKTPLKILCCSSPPYSHADTELLT
jgi:mannose-6-phosphate isomerase-like protein (cupin superfamily)